MDAEMAVQTASEMAGYMVGKTAVYLGQKKSVEMVNKSAGKAAHLADQMAHMKNDTMVDDKVDEMADMMAA